MLSKKDGIFRQFDILGAKWVNKHGDYYGEARSVSGSLGVAKNKLIRSATKFNRRDASRERFLWQEY
jgi:hypothetical protein